MINNRLKKRHENNKEPPNKESPPTNTEILNDYLKNFSHSKDYEKNERCGLKQFLAFYNRRLIDFKLRYLRDYQIYLKFSKDLGFETKKTRFNQARRFIRDFLQYNYEYFDPMEVMLILSALNDRKKWKWNSAHFHKKPNSNRNVILELNEVESIAKYFRDMDFPKYLMVRVLIETGMRKGELRNINIEREKNRNIIPLEEDLDKRFIFTIGKTGEKVYYISEQLAKLLKYHLRERRAKNTDSLAFFISQRGNRIAQNPLHKYLRKACEATGINKRVSTKTFRKTITTLRERMGCPLEKLKILIGHKTSDGHRIGDVTVDYYIVYERQRYISLRDQYDPYKSLNL
ncbi:MAG: tyrosine-type recombinase/integrase [Promethearchaeota archaeon]